MRIGEYAEFVPDMLQSGAIFLILGPPGIGKNQVPEDWARGQGWDVFVANLPMFDPTFIKGYPSRVDGIADHVPFGMLAKCLNATKPTLLILDELGAASTETVKAALRLIKEREIAGKRMPDHVRMLALSNDIGHGMQVMGIVEPAKDRFLSIVNVEPHVEDTITYGLTHEWPGWELAYLHNAPGALHDLTPQKSMQRSGATPRGWDGMSRLDKLGFLDKPVGTELAWGCVGKGRGTEAMAFRGLQKELPDINQVQSDPDHAPIPDNPSARYLVGMAIASRLDGNNFGQFLKYLNRMPQVLRAFVIRHVIKAEGAWMRAGTLPKNHRLLATTGDFTKWSTTRDGNEITQAGAS